MQPKELKPGDVLPSHILRDEYGMNAENRPVIKVVEAEVPQELQDLIPLVERWAIPCDVTRGDYFDKQPAQDVAEFYRTVLPRVESVHAWLDEQPGEVAKWPAAAVHFMYFLRAHDEAYQPTPEEIRKRLERRQALEHKQAMKASISAAEEAFRSRAYERVVSLLTPYEHELEKVLSAKLAMARKKLSGGSTNG